MPAIQPYIIEPIWEQSCSLLPEREVNNPLGCHRPHIPDRVVFEKLVQVLVFECAYWRISDRSCTATTLRRRRDEWIEAGVMDTLEEVARQTYDRIIGLELSDVVVDCCITKAPCGGEKARVRWTAENKASSARRWWTGKVSSSGRWQPRPTATTRRCLPLPPKSLDSLPLAIPTPSQIVTYWRKLRRASPLFEPGLGRGPAISLAFEQTLFSGFDPAPEVVSPLASDGTTGDRREFRKSLRTAARVGCRLTGRAARRLFAPQGGTRERAFAKDAGAGAIALG
jgi:hypothetical protein